MVTEACPRIHSGSVQRQGDVSLSNLPVFHCRLDPYADPYYDYEIERFWRGGQYENFRVQYTDPDPYRNYRVSKVIPLSVLPLTSLFQGLLVLVPFPVRGLKQVLLCLIRCLISQIVKSCLSADFRCRAA